LADLDAIAGKPPGLATVRSLQQQGFHLWVDAGLRRASMAEALATYGVEGIVAGLETLTGPEELGRLVGALGHRVIFSLDLRSGLPLGSRAWESTLPLDIVGKAIQEGVKRILVLDLARVGKGSGTGTESLCQEIALQYPEVELTAGGGVRSTQDLECLKKVGVQAVLVASGLHDCQITRQDLDHFREASTR
jgi:phosphoribosylformimino-5-aminoimidazole carboxamide ribotide isomerase